MRGWVKRVVELLSKRTTAATAKNGESATTTPEPASVTAQLHKNGEVTTADLSTADVSETAKAIVSLAAIGSSCVVDTGDLDYKSPADELEKAGNELRARTREATSSARHLVRSIKNGTK